VPVRQLTKGTRPTNAGREYPVSLPWLSARLPPVFRRVRLRVWAAQLTQCGLLPARMTVFTGPMRPKPFLLYTALIVFVLGLVSIAAIFLTPALTGGEAGLPLYLGAMLAPLGFALAGVFALRSGRRAR
jgi:hypothetical protein